MEVKTNAMVSFTITLFEHRMQSFSSKARDGEDVKRLKLERNGQLFQLRIQCNPKIHKILIWIAIPDKIYVMFPF